MPSVNEEVIRRLYESWNVDDFELGRPLLHPEIEWGSSGVFPGFREVYSGPEGVREFWHTMKEAWEYFTITIRDLYEEGDRIVTDVHFDAVGRESGVKVELPFAHSFELEDGLIRRYKAFPTLDEAFGHAGMPSGQSRPPGEARTARRH